MMVDPTSKRQPTLADRLIGLARSVGRINARVETLEARPVTTGAATLYIQPTQPAMEAGKPWQWWKTVDGALSQFFVFDGVL